MKRRRVMGSTIGVMEGSTKGIGLMGSKKGRGHTSSQVRSHNVGNGRNLNSFKIYENYIYKVN